MLINFIYISKKERKRIKIRERKKESTDMIYYRYPQISTQQLVEC